jgi:hypothetical protein
MLYHMAPLAGQRTHAYCISDFAPVRNVNMSLLTHLKFIARRDDSNEPSTDA